MKKSSRADTIAQLSKLSVAEKILLVEDIWDDIASDESSIPVPASHIRELDRRMKKNAENPGRLLTLSELKRRIEKRK